MHTTPAVDRLQKVGLQVRWRVRVGTPLFTKILLTQRVKFTLLHNRGGFGWNLL